VEEPRQPANKHTRALQPAGQRGATGEQSRQPASKRTRALQPAGQRGATGEQAHAATGGLAQRRRRAAVVADATASATYVEQQQSAEEQRRLARRSRGLRGGPLHAPDADEAIETGSFSPMDFSSFLQALVCVRTSFLEEETISSFHTLFPQ
jgi:hypothetical protein